MPTKQSAAKKSPAKRTKTPAKRAAKKTASKTASKRAGSKRPNTGARSGTAQDAAEEINAAARTADLPNESPEAQEAAKESAKQAAAAEERFTSSPVEKAAVAPSLADKLGQTNREPRPGGAASEMTGKKAIEHGKHYRFTQKAEKATGRSDAQPEREFFGKVISASDEVIEISILRRGDYQNAQRFERSKIKAAEPLSRTVAYNLSISPLHYGDQDEAVKDVSKKATAKK